jgi:glycosyltransferase involved in cell wall biosynthesis
MKVGILNNYLSTFGGGEKDTYVIANRLAQLGFQVDVFTFEEKVPTATEIEAFFGPGHCGFAIRRLAGADEKARDRQLRSALKGYSVFINHCAGSSFVNPCPVGIYWLMFPMQPPGLFLRSYHHIVCISEFTRFYCRHLWGADLATTVLHPCCEDQPGPAGPRAREILTVGRFNWSGHKKNQDLLVDAFEELLASLPGWRLTLIGKLFRSQRHGAAQAGTSLARRHLLARHGHRRIGAGGRGAHGAFRNRGGRGHARGGGSALLPERRAGGDRRAWQERVRLPRYG